MDKRKERALIGLAATCVRVDPKSLPQCSEVVLAVLESVLGQTSTQRCQMKASVCGHLKECKTCSKTREKTRELSGEVMIAKIGNLGAILAIFCSSEVRFELSDIVGGGF